MAFQSVPNTIELTFHCICNSEPVVNTFYFLAPAGYEESSVQALAEEGWAWWATEMPAKMPVAFYLNQAIARGLENENDSVYTYEDSDVFGTIASNPTPSNVAYCVSRRSAYTGRSARGRVFIGPLAVSVLQADENLVTSVWSGNLVDSLNTLRTTIHGILTLTEVIVSRYANKARRTVGVTFPVVNYVATDLRVDSQRARLPND